MIQYLVELNKFAFSKGMDCCLQLPIAVENDLPNTLNSRFKAYKNLLCQYFANKEIIERLTATLEKLNTSIISFLEDKSGKGKNSIDNVLNIIEKDYNIFSTLLKSEVKTGQILWRARSGSKPFTSIEEFYHPPFMDNEGKMIAEFGDGRFSDKKYPLWYLGYTDYVCTREGRIWNLGKDEILSIAELRHIGKEPLNVVDLTMQRALQISGSEETAIAPYIAWWIIACSYCVGNQKDLDYKFPQYLSNFIRVRFPDVEGIRYYTVRDEDLNPNANTCVNLALFTKNGESKYDVELCRKFELTGRIIYITKYSV